MPNTCVRKSISAYFRRGCFCSADYLQKKQVGHQSKRLMSHLLFSKFPHLTSTPFTNLVQTNFPRRQRFGRAIRQLDNQFAISINGCRNAAEVLPVLGKSDVFANHKGALTVFF